MSCLKTSEGKKPLYLVDIDGTMTKYLYDDAELVADPKKMDQALENAKPFPWVAKSGIFVDTNTVIFITGRKSEQGDMTRNWIKKKIWLNSFLLELVPYKTKEQYVADKVNKILRYVSKASYEYEIVVIIDDDEQVLRKIDETLCNLSSAPPVEIRLVGKDGKVTVNPF
jgi:hypothetical protein